METSAPRAGVESHALLFSKLNGCTVNCAINQNFRRGDT